MIVQQKSVHYAMFSASSQLSRDGTMTIVKIQNSRGQIGQPEILPRNRTQNVYFDHWPWSILKGGVVMVST